ncbi:hypothetical protein [Rhizobium laguerreae]|uniref:hypothetical protein n=1 Tax=Rhizobium laguerreae TaxID=1076926 RepID=UPI001C927B05|nr:hypothetical protein [Rhizobium laguerreae]MBY3168699.1 hypothetical protein [Rhizobium laguerreae]
MLKTYIITFFAPQLSVENANRWIMSSPYVVSYWNYLPLIYCIKSGASVHELRVHFEPLFGFQNFLIAEINPYNLSGRLPPDAWSWFTQNHYQPPPVFPGAQVPPNQPSGLPALPPGAFPKK